MRGLLVAAALAAWTGCAPTTIGPGVIRLAPGAGGPTGGLALRTGPRITVPISTGRVFGSFAGDKNIWGIPQWGLTYDAVTNVPVAPRTDLHLGFQGEFYYPFPLPAYGLYTGFSHYIPVGRASIAPAVLGRFATDFGISTLGGPGTQAGGELTVTFGWHPEEDVAVGISPFACLQQHWSGLTELSSLYAGGALAARFKLGSSTYEVSGGFGRVFLSNGVAWNAPIIGVRMGL